MAADASAPELHEHYLDATALVDVVRQGDLAALQGHLAWLDGWMADSTPRRPSAPDVAVIATVLSVAIAEAHPACLAALLRCPAARNQLRTAGSLRIFASQAGRKGHLETVATLATLGGNAKDVLLAALRGAVSAGSLVTARGIVALPAWPSALLLDAIPRLAHAAASQETPGLLDWVLQHSPKVLQDRLTLRRLLLGACQAGSIASVDTLLALPASHRIDWATADVGGKCLEAACSGGRLSLVQHLLAGPLLALAEAGAWRIAGPRALVAAATGGHLPVLQALLAAQGPLFVPWDKPKQSVVLVDTCIRRHCWRELGELLALPTVAAQVAHLLRPPAIARARKLRVVVRDFPWVGAVRRVGRLGPVLLRTSWRRRFRTHATRTARIDAICGQGGGDGAKAGAAAAGMEDVD